jgi:Glycosyl transferase family 2
MAVSLAERTRSVQSTTPSLFELALAYTEAGISVVPISPLESSSPNRSQDTAFDCAQYLHQRIATPQELREWFADNERSGLAALHGAISGGLECLELLYAAVAKLWRKLVTLQGGKSLLEKLPAARMDAEGCIRLYYRCPSPSFGSRWLAKFELPSEPGVARLQLLALLHGEGTWTALPASGDQRDGSDKAAGWHGPDLCAVPTLTEDERQLLLESASCLNAWVDPGATFAPAAPNEFDSRVTWEQILTPLGWRKAADFGEVAVWHTPERTKPGYCAISGIGFSRDLLYVIRSATAYSKFGAFASFYFDGDVEKARSVRPPRPASSRWETATGERYRRAIKQAGPPLVSCLMPTTGDRRGFLPQAIKCFQRQTYPNLELVILCDGDDDMTGLVPRDDKRIRYTYLGRERQTLGAKLNLGCERAKGDLIAHFDDDDWSHPDRLSFQAGALLAEEAEFCGLSLILFYVIGTGEVWLSQTPALLHPSLWPALPAGATFLYRREFWAQSPFPDLRLGPDMAFIRASGRQDNAVIVSDCRLYVAMIHNSNTDNYSRKDSSYWSPWTGDIREVLGSELDFYESLGQDSR